MAPNETSGLSTVNEDQIAERGARLARRDDREYRKYSREEQRRQPGCPAREMDLDHRGQATRVNRRGFLGIAAGAMLGANVSRQRTSAGWLAGAAAVDITPRSSLWMAGFALRKLPSQGVALPLHAKALALRLGSEPLPSW